MEKLPLGKVWQFLKKLNISLLFNPAIPLLGLHPRKMKTYVRTKTCMEMFIGILFIEAKHQK